MVKNCWKSSSAGLKSVVFDRSGYVYTGRVKALADAAREAGLEFSEGGQVLAKNIEKKEYKEKC